MSDHLPPRGPKTLTAEELTGFAAKSDTSRGVQRSFAPPPGRTREDMADDICAASLAGGIIAASGKPHTPEEEVKLMTEVRAALRAADRREPTQGGPVGR